MKKRIFSAFIFSCFIISCSSSEKEPELIPAESTQSEIKRFITLHYPDVPGDDSTIFNERVGRLLYQYLKPCIREVSRYELRVVAIDYKTPDETGKDLTYYLSLEAELTDTDESAAKFAWSGKFEIETERSPSQSEEEIIQLLAEKVCKDIADEVPVKTHSFISGTK
ncbi:MAG: hypothetical protein ABIH42_01350 [Planctomycetota bacterium]